MATTSICVFCGARSGDDPQFTTQAAALGQLLATENMRLVYGAGDVGLMGEIARAAQQAGGETFGVIPLHLVHWEVGKTDLTRYIVTENMHERKKVMFMNSDAVVVLPGGAGSLDELFEVLTWRQIGLHQKPVFLLNINGYWDKLIDLIDHVINRGFADASLKSYLSVLNAVEDFPAALRAEISDRQAATE